MKKSAIFTIFKKELFRFFKDKRTLVALIMPGFLLFAVYSVMGEAFKIDEGHVPKIAIVDLPSSLSPMFTGGDVFAVSLIERDEIEEKKDEILKGKLDILLVFPEKFDDDVALYSPSLGIPAPNIELYFNSSDANSTAAYSAITALLDSYEDAFSNKFDVNRQLDGTSYDLATDEDIMGMALSSLMPMLIISFLYSGCMAVAPESISGEKERGTIATLLITPTKRIHIAVGKILALSVMALISGASSTVGVILSLPKLMGTAVNINNVYSIGDYVMLVTIILSTTLLLITLISIISAYAKTVKEATSYVTPLMVLSMVIGLSGMFGSAASSAPLYLVPVYNSVQCMVGIFSFNANALYIAITASANIALCGLGVFILTRMFDSEKIMFNK